MEVLRLLKEAEFGPAEERKQTSGGGIILYIDDYLSDRWVIYKGDKLSIKEEVTCGAPQESRVRLFFWNVMCGDFLHLDLGAGTSIIGFADDLLVTNRRFFQYPRIVLGEHEVEWKTSIKYLGVQLDRRLSFGEHIQIVTAKSIQCGATRLKKKHGEVGFYLAQAFSSHGCFNAYLRRFKKRDEETCCYSDFPVHALSSSLSFLSSSMLSGEWQERPFVGQWSL